MNELVKIEKKIIGCGEINSVDARELHQFLEVKTRFNDWITSRINTYGFLNDIDYLKISNGNYSGIGMAPINYFLTIDMAKELSMVERNEKGRQARKYFIECERRLKSQLPNFNDPVAAARAWADAKEAAIAAKKIAQLESTRADRAEHKANELAEEIGYSQNWKQVIAIPWLKAYFDLSDGLYRATGMALRKISIRMGSEIRSAPHPKYGKVNVYHISVVNKLEQLVRSKNALAQYRKKPSQLHLL